jgi:O-antigen/teichoic acid export membrane protein
VRALVNFPLVIAGIWFFGLAGALAATAISSAAGLWVNRQALRRKCHALGIVVRYDNLKPELPILWRFACPAFLSSVSAILAQWLSNTILVHQRGGYGEMGLVNASNQWRTLLMFLPGVAIQVALPLMSSSLGTKDSEKDYGKVLEITQSITVLVVFPLSVLLMFLSGTMIKIYGHSFADGTLVLIGFLCTAMLQSVGAVLGPAIQSKGRMWLGFALNCVWGLVLVALVWFLAPVWGARATAMGFAGSYIIAAACTYLYLARELPNGMLIRMFLAIGFVVVMTGVCISLPAHVRTLMAVPAALVTLAAALLVFTSGDVRRTLLARMHSKLPMAEPVQN